MQLRVSSRFKDRSGVEHRYLNLTRCPPRSKKLSSAPVRGSPSTSANSRHSTSSLGVRGPRPAEGDRGLGVGQRAHVELAVGVHRQPCEHDEGGRDHVLGQPLPEVVAEPPDERACCRGPAPGCWRTGRCRRRRGRYRPAVTRGLGAADEHGVVACRVGATRWSGAGSRVPRPERVQRPRAPRPSRRDGRRAAGVQGAQRGELAGRAGRPGCPAPRSRPGRRGGRASASARPVDDRGAGQRQSASPCVQHDVVAVAGQLVVVAAPLGAQVDADAEGGEAGRVNQQFLLQREAPLDGPAHGSARRPSRRGRAGWRCGRRGPAAGCARRRRTARRRGPAGPARRG